MEIPKHLSTERKVKTVEMGGEIFNFTCMSERDQYEENQRKLIEEREKRLDYIKKLKMDSLMDARFKECKFENFIISNDNKKYFDFGRYYAYNFDEFKAENHGLLIYGDPGTGKSYLTFCIANYLLEKSIPVIACSVSTIIEKVREYSTFGSNKKGQFFKLLKQVDLLIIDDLGSEHNTEWINSVLYDVIDLRYRSNQPLIITTNLEPDTALKKKLTSSDGVTRTYDRIYEMCRRIKLTCQPRRIKEGDKKQAEFNKLFTDIKKRG